MKIKKEGCSKCPEYLCDYFINKQNSRNEIENFIDPTMLVEGETFSILPYCNSVLGFAVYKNDITVNTYSTLTKCMTYLLDEYDELSLADRLSLLKIKKEINVNSKTNKEQQSVHKVAA